MKKIVNLLAIFGGFTLCGLAVQEGKKQANLHKGQKYKGGVWIDEYDNIYDHKGNYRGMWIDEYDYIYDHKGNYVGKRLKEPMK